MVDTWLRVRHLDGLLRFSENLGEAYFYKYNLDPKMRAVPYSDGWEVAYHGTWWYALWSIVECGVLCASSDEKLGHEFWQPGVYCSPNKATAAEYARPHMFFNDGMYHRVVLELRVNTDKIIKERKRGGGQWIFPEDAVAIFGVHFMPNAPPYPGQERLNDWRLDMEAKPDEVEAPPPIDIMEVASQSGLECMAKWDGTWGDPEHDEWRTKHVESSAATRVVSHQMQRKSGPRHRRNELLLSLNSYQSAPLRRPPS